MTTINPNEACPAVSVLVGAMGSDDFGNALWPEHKFTDYYDDPADHCAHCGLSADRIAKEATA